MTCLSMPVKECWLSKRLNWDQAIVLAKVNPYKGKNISDIQWDLNAKPCEFVSVVPRDAQAT